MANLKDELKCDGCKKPGCCNRYVVHVLEEHVELKLCPDCYKKYVTGTWEVLKTLGVDTSEYGKDMDDDPDNLPF